MHDPRARLARLIAERGDDYAGISRLIGRNPAYIQQFIRRGTPRALAERDRTTIARYFGVDEHELGAPEGDLAKASRGLERVPRLDVGASAGGGAFADDDDRAEGTHGFGRDWLRAHGWQADSLSMIRVEGDSMEPTLSHGDELLVEACDRVARDGVHVIRMDGSLMVKRLARGPGGRLAIRSDNAAYPSWENVRAGEITVIGRVLWMGRVL